MSYSSVYCIFPNSLKIVLIIQFIKIAINLIYFMEYNIKIEL